MAVFLAVLLAADDFFAVDFFAADDVFAAVLLAGADFFAAVFLAPDDFFAAVFLAGADFFAAVFLAPDDFFAAVLLAGADFFAADFFAADDFFAAVLLAGADFFAADFFAPVVFLPAVRLAAAAAFLAGAVAFFAAGEAAATVAFGSFLAPEMTFFRSAPAVNFGTAFFFDFIRSPVCGLRTQRASRTRFSNEPKPVMATFSPLATSRVIVSRTDSSAWAAALRFPSKRADSVSMSCDLFTSFPSNETSGAEPVLDFLQRTLGIRGVSHNHHAGLFALFLRRRFDDRSASSGCLRGLKGENPLVLKGILAHSARSVTQRRLKVLPVSNRALSPRRR